MHLLSLSFAAALLFSQIVTGNPVKTRTNEVTDDTSPNVVNVTASYTYKLIFDYDNRNNSAPFSHDYKLVETGKYASQTFNQAVMSEAKKQNTAASIKFDADTSYGPASASVSSEISMSNEMSKFLEQTTKLQKETSDGYEWTNTTHYEVGPKSRAVLYQRVFECPGMLFQEKAGLVSRQEPFPKEQLVEKVNVTLVMKPQQFIKNLTLTLANQVVYGDRETDMPPNRVRDMSGQRDDLNLGMGGKYVWLVPEYTNKVSEALTIFDFAITDKADSRYKDLAAGAGGKFRYLLPARHDANKDMFVTELTLVRANKDVSADLSATNMVWKGLPQGHTIDMNEGRGGTYLYLVWQLQRAHTIPK
ncbi:hypothetical protein DXG01_005697 [Tephrocybe rancida]|nr:hypothetical protein DXG01_005697 [Tephrocybe rancida]